MEQKQENRRFETKAQMLVYFMKGSVRFFVFSVVYTLVVTLLDMVNPRIISFTVDSVISNKPSSLPPFIMNWLNSFGGTEYLKSHMGVIALTVITVALLRALFRYLWRLYNAKGAETVVETARNEVFHHLLYLPSSWHSSHHTGDIIQRCTSDVETIKMFLSEQLGSLFRIIPTLILAFVFMGRIHVKLMLVALVFLPLIVGYSLFFHKRIGSAFRKADEEEGKLSAIAQENLTGVRVVRAFGKEMYERNRFEEKNRTYTALWIHLMRLLASFWCSMDLLSGAQILLITSLGAVYAVHGELTAGEFIAFLAYNTMMIWPVRMLGRIIANLSKAGVAIDRLREIMNGEPEQDAPDAVEPDMSGDISFEHVNYVFENGTAEVLHDVSFTVKAGTTVGILGGTGSGKSTLMYLLDRIYPLNETDGTITIGGVDIQKIKASYLRSHIGMVLQEPYLFSRSLEENIRIASRSSDLREVREAAGIAALDETIEHFEDGYDTFVGERGVTLSGGQKQRTAIAQMLIRKPPIMVFDDSLSAVDAETDAKIRAALQENTGDATVFLIAHRITTLMHADQIIVMDRGVVAERGNHQELMELGGIYRKIFDLQMAGREVD
ncbi:MAG: ABC transporter ATP-binding protein [Solobacterium sp.]|nr:ABC transporter ATP-binding protein [Solobacterium sp.]